jgi:DegV family protein with EDD domain
MTVQIITDSGSDLSPTLIGSHAITVVPLQVLIDGQTYLDGQDLSTTEFYAKMKAAPSLPKTSQPTPHALEEAYRTARERGPVIGIHLSGALSGTWQTATMVAKRLDGDIPVIDSRTGSGALCLMVLEAARMAAAGAGVDAIVRRVEEMHAQTYTLVMMNTLENAVKGGRVTAMAGMVGALLGIKPIVQMTRQGKVETVDKVRGRQRSIDRVLEIAGSWGIDWTERQIVIGHGACLEEATKLGIRAKERFAPKEILLLEIGATIGTYAAEGALLFGC